jgi:stage II sporulation protein D
VIVRFYVLLVLLCWGAVQVAAQPDTLRVRLFDRFSPETLEIMAVEAEVLLFAENYTQPLLRLPAGAQLQIARRGPELQLRTPGGTLFARWIRLHPTSNGRLRLTAQRGPQSIGPFTYSGWLRISPKEDGAGLYVINHVAFEEYVAAVVAREHQFDDLESTKALAVAIRTYALRRILLPDTAQEIVDHEIHQMYEGIDRVTPLIREAVEQTRGEVLTYQGALIEAVYSASNGGHTADNDAVWAGLPQPYLRGRLDPYDQAGPYQHWEASVPRDRLLQLLSQRYGTRITGFRISERSTDGRVTLIELLRENSPPLRIRANEFRLLVNDHFGRHTLRSTLFQARREGNTYRFKGRGFGHGVGLSQYGALEMARQGHDYRQILAFYYPGTAITRYEAGSLLAAQQPVAAPPIPQSAKESPVLAPSKAAEGSLEKSTPRIRPAPGWGAPSESPAPTPPRRRIGW